jgi:hypothetical protein
MKQIIHTKELLRIMDKLIKMGEIEMSFEAGNKVKANILQLKKAGRNDEVVNIMEFRYHELLTMLNKSMVERIKKTSLNGGLQIENANHNSK